jgi:hypothetical protein
MSSDTAVTPQSESVRIVSALMMALSNAGHEDALPVVMGAIQGSLGLERAACLWDAACCQIEDQIDRLSEQENNDVE